MLGNSLAPSQNLRSLGRAVLATATLALFPQAAGAAILDTAVFGGHRYYLLSPNYWDLAEAEAVSLGGHLVAVGSQAEQDFLWSNWGQFGGLWIGLSDQAIEGTFVWTNGEPLAFTYWGPGEPNDGNGFGPEDFVSMATFYPGQPGGWNDATGLRQDSIYSVAEVPRIVNSYYTLEPCRAADTRNAASASGGPALAANTTRTFPVAGVCGVPSTATAVALNVTVVDETDVGDLRLYPAGGAQALATSTINFAVGSARANNAVVPLGTGGQVTVQCDMPVASTGRTLFLFDVMGYFE